VQLIAGPTAGGQPPSVFPTTSCIGLLSLAAASAAGFQNVKPQVATPDSRIHPGPNGEGDSSHALHLLRVVQLIAGRLGAFTLKALFYHTLFPRRLSMFPLIPLFALIAIFGGGATLLWYDELSKEQKQEADRLAGNYARQIYGKAIDELSKDQAGHVARMTKQHFAK
jgi:hypothetical protein